MVSRRREGGEDDVSMVWRERDGRLFFVGEEADNVDSVDARERERVMRAVVDVGGVGRERDVVRPV